MNTGFVWLTAMKDLRRRMQDPWSLFFWLGMPLVIVSLILLAFGGGGGRTPTAHVLVVDHDDSFVSGLIVRGLGRGEVVEAQVADSADARAQLDDGKVTAVLTVPAGFGQAVLDRKPTTLQLRTNPAQRLLPGIVEETVRMFTEAGFYVQEVFGDELDTFGDGPPEGMNAFPNATVNLASTSINEKVGRINTFASPPLIDVETTVDSLQTGPEPSLGGLFFPGILFMALLFMASGMAGDVWVEKESGTLRRLVSSPQRTTDFLAGKALAGTILMAGVSFAALALGAVAVGVNPATIPLAVVWAAFAGTVFLLILMLIHLFASSARTAGVLSTMIVFPLLMVGGSFFPTESMPAWLASIGRLTPNGWALAQFKSILAGAVDPAALGPAFAGLLLVAALAFTLAVQRLRRGFVGR